MKWSSNLFCDSGEMCKMGLIHRKRYQIPGIIIFEYVVSTFTGYHWRNEILKVSETSLRDEFFSSICE